jgi:hypothetical protein
MTPLTIGLIDAALRDVGVQPRYQDPEYVMKAFSDIITVWKRGVVQVIPGDNLLKNEHLRSAGAHALYGHSALKVEVRRASKQ